MTLHHIILNTDLINMKTEVTVRKKGRIAVIDNWFTDHVLEYLDNKITSFKWYNNDIIEITVTDETEEIQDEAEDE